LPIVWTYFSVYGTQHQCIPTSFEVCSTVLTIPLAACTGIRDEHMIDALAGVLRANTSIESAHFACVPPPEMIPFWISRSLALFM